ncbi:transcription factor bHLH82-like [Hibiscus syriacus]|uniref:Transcription factor bHLH82-like n=1 Tax=Hibiscus syriacus TaxID=106335 RepID=A0A6A3A9N9_HIBSY|nr:transcription factor bHLH82-like [Hibiscus syriacus]
MFGYPTFPRSSLTSPLFQLTVDESYDLVSSSGSYNSPSSLPSCSTQKQSLMQRSHSLHSHFDSNLNEFVDSNYSRVRRALSTADTEQGRRGGGRRSESPLWNESSASAIIEGMSRTHRYSPEEKKQRIERYRSKRNLRNFNKKIKYTCRKTLADSRPRIRGRFAKNEEIENNVPQVEWSHHIGGDEEDENWIHFLDSLSANQKPSW